jgi:autotransporter adhesin
MGYAAGLTISSGNNNTFLGFAADAAAENLINSMALGSDAIVNASNKVRIGNSQVTVIEGQVAWSNASDRRLKENINYTNCLGLDFINSLQIVSHNYIVDNNKTRYDGFIAQDIEKASSRKQ